MCNFGPKKAGFIAKRLVTGLSWQTKGMIKKQKQFRE